MRRAEDGRAKQKLHCVVNNDGQLTVNINNVCRLQSGNEEQFAFPPRPVRCDASSRRVSAGEESS